MTRIAQPTATVRANQPTTTEIFERERAAVTGNGAGFETARPHHIAQSNVGQRLQSSVGSGKILKKGASGEDVKEMQQLLNRAGANPPLETDGKFGPKTQTALRQFQQQSNISVDGKFGPQSMGAMQQSLQMNPAAPQTPANPTSPQNPGNPTAPEGPQGAQGAQGVQDTSGMSQDQKYDYYAQLIEQNGGQLKDGVNQRNIVGLRTETDADVNGGNGRYDDKMVMIWKDSQGRKQVREYTGNTEPSARYRGRMGVDVNGDGRLDQGRLPSGYYEFTKGHSSRLGSVLRPTRNTMAERDTNQDGLFNDGATGSAGRSMLFHKGGNSMTGSAGCQTLNPTEWRRFWRDLNANGNPGTIGYTLINT